MNKSVSEKIFELRKARALTQEKLGESLGVSSQAVSKWEKGESLPDIMMLPKLCEILGISIDSLLEMPISAKKDNCMESLAAYSREAGSIKACYEAFRSCSNAVDDQANRGSALISYDGISICAAGGIGIVFYGEETLKNIAGTDMDSAKKLFGLLCDEKVLRVIRSLTFDTAYSEAEIAERSELSQEESEAVLFKLMKHNFCECDSFGKYLFGTHSYALFAVLGGLYLSSADGYRAVNSIGRNFLPGEK